MQKQVIVVRHDLHMRLGKAIAQGSHASMMFLVQRMATGQPLSDDEEAWFAESAMTKICVRVDSADELDAIEIDARARQLPVHVITDAGRTEFRGVPTKTCLAIGPADEALVNQVTGSLKLL